MQQHYPRWIISFIKCAGSKSVEKSELKPANEVTIGIPSFNEERNISNLLSVLERQAQSGKVRISEVIISDDSTDRTPQTVEEFRMKSCLSIRLFHHNVRRGAAAAWNEIFANSNGSIIVLYDADTIPHALCTDQLVSRIDSDTRLCASNSMPVDVRGVGGRAGAFVASWLRSVRKAGLSKYTVMGRAVSMDCGLAKSIKIPENTIAIDLYLQCKVLQAGFNVAYDDNALLYFRPSTKVEDFASQVLRAIAGHSQIQHLVSSSPLNLSPPKMLVPTLGAIVRDPLGAASTIACYASLPYYRIKLGRKVLSSMWHTSESSKMIQSFPASTSTR